MYIELYLAVGISLLWILYINNNTIESLVSSIEGKVIKGDQISRKIDYPTANMKINTPLECGIFNGQSQYGKTTIISGGGKFVESHIHNFNKNIYGEKLRIDNIEKLHFKNDKDCRLAKMILK